MDFLNVAVAAAVCAVLYALVKNVKPEAAPAVLAGAVVCVLLWLGGLAGEMLNGVDELTELAGANAGRIKILVKCMALCLITELAADVCRENGAVSLAGAVTAAGRAAALCEALPLIMPAARLALKFIESYEN